MEPVSYGELLKSLLRFFYFQRCGCELHPADGGVFSHRPCHTQKATIYGTQTRIDVSGGWHDAGDYGRYTAPGAKAVADLLLSYLAAPELFQQLHVLPARKKRSPTISDADAKYPADILMEAQYELDFLLKMQRSDGGVYHKVTCAHFCGFVAPDEEQEELLVSPVSTCATGDFAGVMALAYMVFAPLDAVYANRCLHAARKASVFLRQHQPMPFHNPTGVDTGEYDDSCDTDERFFAAAALHAATGESDYAREALALLEQDFPMDLGWENMGGYGCLLCRYSHQKLSERLKTAVEQRLLSHADALLTAAGNDQYGISLSGNFRWGSNMYLLNNAIILCEASRIIPSMPYLPSALRHLSYIWGDNPLGICYVTGFGSQSPMHPHHRPSVAAGQPMPGMLVGGPNGSLQDECAKVHLQGCPAHACYVDMVESYSTNEVAIYWNAPLIYLIAHLYRSGNLSV